VGSDNPSGAGNQQETGSSTLELDARWVTCFVDGEGCFCVSVHRNAMVRSTGGWQLHPTFRVSQHNRHRAVLDALVRFFGCGNVRGKGPGSAVAVYAVDSLRSLADVIVPFFEHHPLIVKAHDFHCFAEIVGAMQRREHLTSAGFERLVRLAYDMNVAGKQRTRPIETILEGSSETARQAPVLDG
jgi:hypothetical protein